jgi:hypothetical protein
MRVTWLRQTGLCLKKIVLRLWLNSIIEFGIIKYESWQMVQQYGRNHNYVLFSKRTERVTLLRTIVGYRYDMTVFCKEGLHFPNGGSIAVMPMYFVYAKGNLLCFSTAIRLFQWVGYAN